MAYLHLNPGERRNRFGRLYEKKPNIPCCSEAIGPSRVYNREGCSMLYDQPQPHTCHLACSRAHTIRQLSLPAGDHSGTAQRGTHPRSFKPLRMPCKTRTSLVRASKMLPCQWGSQYVSLLRSAKDTMVCFVRFVPEDIHIATGHAAVAGDGQPQFVFLLCGSVRLSSLSCQGN